MTGKDGNKYITVNVGFTSVEIPQAPGDDEIRKNNRKEIERKIKSFETHWARELGMVQNLKDTAVNNLLGRVL